jgi:hypothetical protein
MHLLRFLVFTIPRPGQRLYVHTYKHFYCHLFESTGSFFIAPILDRLVDENV